MQETAIPRGRDFEHGPWNGEKFWVSNFNFEPEVTSKFNFPRQIIFHDVTLRDGEQTPGVVLRSKEKVEIAKKLDEVGVHRIEAGMPVVSQEDFDAVKEISHLGLSAKIFAFSRLVKEDIEVALKCDVEGIICEGPVGVPKLKQFSWTHEQVIERAVDAIDFAKKHGLWTAFFGVDGTRADPEFMIQILKSVSERAHPDAFVIVDTFGCASPEGFGGFVRKMKNAVKEPLEVHTHNDFGLGVADAISGLMNGAGAVHTSVNGIGERSGNASFEEVAMSLKFLYGQEVNFDFSKFKELSSLVQRFTKFPLAPNKPVVGDRVFTREAGISIAGWMKYNLGSEAYLPELVGNSHGVFLGKKSGKHSIEWKLGRMGLSASDDQIEQILSEVKKSSEASKSEISDEQFRKIVGSILNR